MDCLESIKSRRSTRRFRDTLPSRELIMEVVEAGRYAPSGGNNQKTHFLVITNKSVLNDLANMVQKAFSDMEITEGMYRSMANSIHAAKTGKYTFHYNAPVLILTANQKDYTNNIADCACCLENMMLAANALDLGSCWINQLKWLNEDPTILPYLQKLGLGENERVYGGIVLGFPAEGFPNRIPLPRVGNPVTFAE